MSASLSIEQSIRLLDRKRLVLADPAVRPRAEMARYLRSIGMEVREAGTLAEALTELRSFGPALIAFDIDLPGAGAAELARAVRLASERRILATPASDPLPTSILPTRTLVLLTCNARTPKPRLLAAITPAVAGVIVTPCRPETMIQRLARVLDQPTTVASASDERPAVSTVATNNSLLQHRVLCPFHDTPVEARRYSLRMGKMESALNFFDVPVYTKPIGNADPVDFHRLCVTVCPECLFASPDPAHFLPVVPASRSAQKPATHPAHSPQARLAVMANTADRQRLAGALRESFFTEHRAPEDAVIAYQLAIASSQALLHTSATSPGDELVRQGNYHLRIAHLQETHRDAATTDHIEHAAKLLREAFSTLPESALPRNIYQVVATGIYLGEDREAHQYLGQLAKLRQQTTDPSARQLIDRYLVRGARAWEDRDHHRRPPAAAKIPFTQGAPLTQEVPFTQGVPFALSDAA